jgi:uncharacterized membrane protein
MSTKKISSTQYSFLKQALQDWVSEKALSAEQADQLIESYEPTQTFSFIRILSAIGGLLLGFGVLSFIASNWDVMSRPLKLVIIIGFLIGFNLGGYLLRNLYPKTSSALFYVGALIYGAGIFLIEQLFHIASSNQTAFLLWAVGLLPLAFLRKDIVLKVATLVLFFIWLFSSTFDANLFPWLGILVLLPFYLLYKQKKNDLFFFLINAFGLIWLLMAFNELEIDSLWIAFSFFIIGLILLYQKQWVLSIQGNLLIGISGLTLTIPEVWDLSNKGISYSIPAIVFAVALSLYLLKRIHGGSLFSIVLICALIIRYYVDLTYDFLPKSIFFIIAGLILLGFGYSFEKRRRQGGLNHE